MAYHDIASGVDFVELTDTSSPATSAGPGNWSLSAPANLITVEHIRNATSDYLLGWIPVVEFLRLPRATLGPPKKWSRRETSILLYPTPDAVYTLEIDYKRTPAKLSLDADVTILPPYVDTAIWLLATSYGFQAVGEDARAISWLNRVIAYLSSRITEQDFSSMIEGLEKTRAVWEESIGR